MELQWKEMSMEIQERLEQSLLKNIKRMNEEGLSCFMKGGVGMGYEWNKRKRMKEMIFQRFGELYGGVGETVSGREIVNIIFSWGETGILWEELSQNTQNSCFNGIDQCASFFNSQAISNIILG
jgi:hypothetical protein